MTKHELSKAFNEGQFVGYKNRKYYIGCINKNDIELLQPLVGCTKRKNVLKAEYDLIKDITNCFNDFPLLKKNLNGSYFDQMEIFRWLMKYRSYLEEIPQL